MLDAISGEDFQASVIQRDRDVNGEFFLRCAQYLGEAFVEAQPVGGLIESGFGGQPRIELLFEAVRDGDGGCRLHACSSSCTVVRRNHAGVPVGGCRGGAPESHYGTGVVGRVRRGRRPVSKTKRSQFRRPEEWRLRRWSRTVSIVSRVKTAGRAPRWKRQRGLEIELWAACERQARRRQPRCVLWARDGRSEGFRTGEAKPLGRGYPRRASSSW